MAITTRFVVAEKATRIRRMITENVKTFLRHAERLESHAAAVPARVFMVSPESFTVAEETRADNSYMNSEASVDTDLAMKQFGQLVELISAPVSSATPSIFLRSCSSRPCPSSHSGMSLRSASRRRPA